MVERVGGQGRCPLCARANRRRNNGRCVRGRTERGLWPRRGHCSFSLSLPHSLRTDALTRPSRRPIPSTRPAARKTTSGARRRRVIDFTAPPRRTGLVRVPEAPATHQSPAGDVTMRSRHAGARRRCRRSVTLSVWKYNGLYRRRQ